MHRLIHDPRDLVFQREEPEICFAVLYRVINIGMSRETDKLSRTVQFLGGLVGKSDGLIPEVSYFFLHS